MACTRADIYIYPGLRSLRSSAGQQLLAENPGGSGSAWSPEIKLRPGEETEPGEPEPLWSPLPVLN